MKMSGVIIAGGVLVMAIAACERGLSITGRGHEDVGIQAMAAAGPLESLPHSGKPIQASRPTVREDRPQSAVPVVNLDRCQHIGDSAATVRRVDPSAALYRGPLTGRQAAGFLREHVPDAPAGVDEVAVYVGDKIGDNTIAVLASGGCVLTVRVTDYKVPE